MFYESWGLLLERADLTLRLQVREHVSDPQARAALDTVATLLSELGAIWPKLYAGIERETQLFEQAISRDPALPVGGPDPLPSQNPMRSQVDPLKAHLDAVRALNDHVERIHGMSGEDSERALQALRAAILGAASIQGEIVERAAAVNADRLGRRI